MPVTTIGKFKDEPERPAAPQYETLADVPEGVWVESVDPSGDKGIFCRSGDGKVMRTIHDDLNTFVSAYTPRKIRVHSVLGRITAIQFDTDADPDA